MSKIEQMVRLATEIVFFGLRFAGLVDYAGLQLVWRYPSTLCLQVLSGARLPNMTTNGEDLTNRWRSIPSSGS